MKTWVSFRCVYFRRSLFILLFSAYLLFSFRQREHCFGKIRIAMGQSAQGSGYFPTRGKKVSARLLTQLIQRYRPVGSFLFQMRWVTKMPFGTTSMWRSYLVSKVGLFSIHQAGTGLSVGSPLSKPFQVHIAAGRLHSVDGSGGETEQILRDRIRASFWQSYSKRVMWVIAEWLLLLRRELFMNFGVFWGGSSRCAVGWSVVYYIQQFIP